MKKLLFSLLTLVSLSAFAQEVISDPNSSHETRTLNGSFTGISVSSGIELFLTQGDSESVAVSASNAKYMDRFVTEVVNGTLKIYFDNKNWNWTKGERRSLKAYVSFKTLEKLSGSAGSVTKMKSPLAAGNLVMKFSSGATFNGSVEATAIEVDQSSGAEMTISGKAGKLQVETSSGATFKGYQLAVDFCDAKASSGGAVNITINKELNAKANSGGDIRYKGEALMREVNISSGGTVKKS